VSNHEIAAGCDRLIICTVICGMRNGSVYALNERDKRLQRKGYWRCLASINKFNVFFDNLYTPLLDLFILAL
jgi:hypothetical protein